MQTFSLRTLSSHSFFSSGLPENHYIPFPLFICPESHTAVLNTDPYNYSGFSLSLQYFRISGLGSLNGPQHKPWRLTTKASLVPQLLFFLPLEQTTYCVSCRETLSSLFVCHLFWPVFFSLFLKQNCRTKVNKLV